jgi:hypothetical protein
LETRKRSWVGRRQRGAAEYGPGEHGPCATDVVRRDPSRSVVNRVLRGHLETFLARFVDEHGGRSFPAHVEPEFTEFVRRSLAVIWPTATGVCGVRTARWTTSSPSRAKGVGSALRVVVDAWRRWPRTSRRT